MSHLKPATIAARHGVDSDLAFGAVVPPIYVSSNFTFAGFDQPRKYDYTRSGNPTRDTLAEALAQLEGGAGAVITATGMAAVNLAVSLVKPGELLVVPHDCYGGSYRLFTALAARGAFELAVIDEGDESALAAALAAKPRMVWIETPSNPLLRVIDIAHLATLAKPAGALVVADNTFLSPLFQNPLALGADIVVHSTTKYINGHSDVVGGAAIAGTAELAQELAWWGNCLGLAGAPFDSFITLRGLRTLPLRMAQHQANAEQVVEFLTQHQAISQVYYPGLKSHLGHSIAARQQQGFGAMVSFELAGDRAQVTRFLDRLQLFSLAVSLGGVESLVAHPATMTHAAMSPEARQTAGIRDNLIRLSMGIEDPGDLVADLAHALA